MAFEQKISIKGVNEAIAELNKLGPAGEKAAQSLQAALNKGEMGKGLEKLGEAASTVFEKIGAGIGALSGSSFGEGGKIFDELASHAVTAGKALVGVFSSVRSGGSEASAGLKAVGAEAATAGQGAAAGASLFARFVGGLAGVATVAVGVVTAVAAVAVAAGVLTYKASAAGAAILDLQYAAGATDEDVQRMGAAADKAAVSFAAMAGVGARVRSGLREASLAADEIVETWDVMKERVQTAAEAVSVAETEQAESAIASAEKIKEAEQEKADAARESAEHQVDAANKVVDAQNAVDSAKANVQKVAEHEQKSLEAQARAENNEYRSEKRSKEDFAERYYDLNDRHKEGKISDQDYQKESAKIAREEQRAKEDQAERREELAEKRAQLQREIQEHREMLEAQNGLRRAIEELAKAIENQKDGERKDKERQEKADRKLEDEKRKAPEEAEKAHKQVDRAHTQQDRIAANKDIFARESQENASPLLRLFSGFKSLNEPGGEQAYLDAQKRIREVRELDDSGQEAAVLGERNKYVRDHGTDENIQRLDQFLGADPATSRRIKDHAAELQETFSAPIGHIKDENDKNNFPSTPKLNAEGRTADSIQQTQTHLEDQLIHGIGGGLNRFFESFAQGFKGTQDRSFLDHKGEGSAPDVQAESGADGNKVNVKNKDGSSVKLDVGAEKTAQSVSRLAPQVEHAGETFGQLRPKVEKAGEASERAGSSISKLSPQVEDSVNALARLAPQFADASSAIGQLAQAARTASEALAKCGCSEGGDASEEGAGHAGGGLISGPGTGTSDSIPAMLSHGEYVVNAAAVSKIGVGTLHALNSGKGFATGGLADAFNSASGYHREARRFASGGLASASDGGHQVSFVLDGKTFGGFSGGKSAVEQLSRHAVMQQVGAIGRRASHAR